MNATKFGLAELDKYNVEVGFKKGDVRTIKGVCTIVGLPITVVPEATEVINKCNDGIKNCVGRHASIKMADAADDEKTKAEIARVKSRRNANKQVNAQAIMIAMNEASQHNTEIARLQKLLKNFS